MLLRTQLANLLETKEEFVDIFSVQDAPDKERTVYVRYSAHGSPYYSPSRLNGLVWTNKASVSIKLAYLSL